LGVVAAGLVLVALDFRTGALDYLPDVAGWLIVAIGAGMAGVRPAALAAVAAAGLSIAELLLPYHYVRFDEVTGGFHPVEGPGSARGAVHQRWDHLSDLRGVAIAAAMVVGAIGVALLLRTLARRAAGTDTAAARRLRIANAAPLVWASPFLFLAAAAVGSAHGYDPVWGGGAEVGGLLAVVSMVALAVVFAAWRDRGWALGPGAETQSPWEERYGQLS
jgi:hypothetical protein